jgi:hypothetical protein
MKITDPMIVSLRKGVEAAQQEFDLAVTFQETWKPTAYDADLHRRMGNSLATNTFKVVRLALRREMVLALMRLWDKREDTVSLERIAQTLKKAGVIDALAVDRARFIEDRDQMRQDLSDRAKEATALIEKYSRGGSHYRVREALQRMRHERLAHRGVRIASVVGPSATDEEIELFYRDISETVRLLLSVVNAVAYDPADAGEVFQIYAARFWAGVRGERTEGHPNYRERFLPVGSRKAGE